MTAPPKRPLAEQLRRDRSKIVASLMEREPELTQRLVDADAALEALRSSVEENAYQLCKTPISAIETHLRRVNVFTSTSNIIDALIAGGYAPNDDNRRANLRDAVLYHTKPGRRLMRRGSDDKIGLAEWGESSQSQSQNQQQS